MRLPDAATGEVLMVAWQTREALERTLASGRATFWSRSPCELWGDGRHLQCGAPPSSRYAADCDGDTLLVRVTPHGPACHTGQETCFGARRAFRVELARAIEARRGAEPGDWYRTPAQPARARRAQGRRGGVEVLLAEAGSDALVGEVADLWFHSMLLLARDGIDPLAPLAELARRTRPVNRSPARSLWYGRRRGRSMRRRNAVADEVEGEQPADAKPPEEVLPADATGGTPAYSRGRKALVGILILLGTIFLALGTYAICLNKTALDTDTYVDVSATSSPTPRRRPAHGRNSSGKRLHVEAALSQKLPPAAQPLA